ncbi:unnamed protein product [Cyprideis torosa]|uniref:Uncharacterized protein n=1 Tax=Cyprideis torosa TaxID=163714 RepID=A0A7R8WT16_9CRUS|nr:unnamed protein product [Cyprideis torosa]CAG0905667.1 unnamed protein product [Cyprideis torosa]
MADFQYNPIREELTAVSSVNEENWGSSANSRMQKSANAEKAIYEIEGLAKRFESQSDLACQEENHTGEESYSCEICSWNFCSFEDLELHSLLHTVEVSSNCQQFDQTLASEHYSRKGRQNHVKHEKIHREMLHNSSFRGELFPTISNCKEHERRHIEEKNPHKGNALQMYIMRQSEIELYEI